MDKRFLTILALLVAAFIGFFVFTQNDSDNNKSGNGAEPTNHLIGEGQKGVKLVEYGDYQCPSCFAYEPVVKQVVEKYLKDIHFQFRNLPLIAIHNNAFSAARAAEAAGMQDRFWQMHDALYEPINWQSWTNAPNVRSVFEMYATRLGLNVEQFKKDYASERANDLVNADLTAFEKTGQPKGTPTFFLDGVVLKNSELVDPVSGQPTLEKFSQKIDAAIAKKSNAQ